MTKREKEKLTKLPHGGVGVREYISCDITGHSTMHSLYATSCKLPFFS